MSAPYRILVTGSRDWTDAELLHDALCHAVYQQVPAVIVHGACPTGADAMASFWARRYAHIGLTEEPHPAAWKLNGRSAGPLRNAAMVSLGADLCLAFISPCSSPRCRRADPHPSHGASGCADLAERAGIPVRRYSLRAVTG